MITFKTLLETVYEPKSGDEKNFKDKHVVAKYKTPYDTESQFTSTATKAKRKADYDSKEDEQVYEAMDPVGKHDADIDNDGDVDKSDKYLIARRKAIGKAIRKEEAEQIDEISRDLARSYIRKVADKNNTGEASPKEVMKRSPGVALAGKKVYGIGGKARVNATEEVDLDEAKTDDHWVHISHAGNSPSPTKDKIVGYSRPSKDAPKLKAGANGAMRVGIAKKKGYMVEESEQIDEISKDLKKSYLAKAKDDVADRKKTISQANKMKNASSRNFHSHSLWMDVAYKNQDKNDSRKAMMAKAKDSMKVKKEEVELDELSKKTLGSYINKASDDMAATSWTIAANDPLKPKVKNGFGRLSKRSKGIAKATDRLTKEDLDEAFKIGAMKLKDGSTVTLTRESVDAFNKLFNQLNSANKAKMEERMLSGKSGFQEILGFAENI